MSSRWSASPTAPRCGRRRTEAGPTRCPRHCSLPRPCRAVDSDGPWRSPLDDGDARLRTPEQGQRRIPIRISLPALTPRFRRPVSAAAHAARNVRSPRPRSADLADASPSPIRVLDGSACPHFAGSVCPPLDSWARTTPTPISCTTSGTPPRRNRSIRDGRRGMRLAASANTIRSPRHPGSSVPTF
jgi:hypothetical protein